MLPVAFLLLIAFAHGQLYDDVDIRSADESYKPAISSGVIIVPSHCKNGQVLINGVCHEVLRSGNPFYHHMGNFIKVPPNCKPPQELINGECRDVWFRAAPSLRSVYYVPPSMLPRYSAVADAPANCQPYEQRDYYGHCRHVWDEPTEKPRH